MSPSDAEPVLALAFALGGRPGPRLAATGPAGRPRFLRRILTAPESRAIFIRYGSVPLKPLALAATSASSQAMPALRASPVALRICAFVSASYCDLRPRCLGSAGLAFGEASDFFLRP